LLVSIVQVTVCQSFLTEVYITDDSLKLLNLKISLFNCQKLSQPW